MLEQNNAAFLTACSLCPQWAAISMQGKRCKGRHAEAEEPPPPPPGVISSPAAAAHVPADTW